MKRYSIDELTRAKDENGDYCEYDEVDAELAKKDEEIARLRKAINKVLQRGEVFDAKGSHSKWIIKVLSEALAEKE